VVVIISCFTFVVSLYKNPYVLVSAVFCGTFLSAGIDTFICIHVTYFFVFNDDDDDIDDNNNNNNNNGKLKVQFMNLLIMQFSTSHCHFLSLTCFANLRTKCNSY
jgi:hypothetical protein